MSAGAQSDIAAIRVDHDVRNITFAGHSVTEGLHGVGARTVGRGPGRTGGRRGTEDGRRKGGKRDLYDGGKRAERNSKGKGKISLFVTAYIQSKKRTQQRFLTSI